MNSTKSAQHGKLEQLVFYCICSKDGTSYEDSEQLSKIVTHFNKTVHAIANTKKSVSSPNVLDNSECIEAFIGYSTAQRLYKFVVAK